MKERVLRYSCSADKLRWLMGKAAEMAVCALPSGRRLLVEIERKR